MREREAKVGTRVRSLINFSDVPKGTEGVIDEEYRDGVMVAWDHPNDRAAHLPEGYREYDGSPASETGILRDGFAKSTELRFLEVVRKGKTDAKKGH